MAALMTPALHLLGSAADGGAETYYLDLVTALHAGGRPTFAAIRKHLDDRQLTDLTLIAAYYLAYGTMIKGFRVQLESKDKLDMEMTWQKAHIERQ